MELSVGTIILLALAGARSSTSKAGALARAEAAAFMPST
jgi:hypothetical protein